MHCKQDTHTHSVFERSLSSSLSIPPEYFLIIVHINRNSFLAAAEKESAKTKTKRKIESIVAKVNLVNDCNILTHYINNSYILPIFDVVLQL